ncbi:MAG: hypothetical protein HYS09_09475 [Chloroflexi bacterium]|nr:hypothetical protein [Chloroflexota bacterium]
MAIGAKGQRGRSAPWTYLANRALATLVPLELGYLISIPISDIFYVLWKSKRETARRNYARILGRPEDDPEVRRLGHETFRQFGRYIVELLSVQGWSLEDLEDRITIHGDEHFDEARRYGKGIIFTSAHMGSIEVASGLLLLKGYRVTTVAEWLEPKMLMDWIVTCRERMGVTLLPATRTGMKLIRVLRRNEMVALVVDMGVRNGDGRPVTFFGHQTYFPTGPARLARISGAPIIFGLAVRRPQNRYEAYISPPIFANRELDPEEDALVTTQRIVDEFERFVRRFPGQWYVFRDMFPQDGAGPNGS